MSAAMSLTLGAIHFIVWLEDRRTWANLFFALAALAVAGIAAGEYWIMTAQTPEQIGRAQQWAHVPIFVLVIAIVGFVRLNFGTGRLWLGVAACAARAASLVINFALPPNLNFRQVTGVRHVEFLGQTVSVPEGVGSSWTRLGELSSLLVLAFVVDASVALWRQGKPESRQRALAVGGSITVFIIIAAGIGALINARIIHWPYLISLPFLGVIVAMGFELSYDVLRAGVLARRLQASENSLHESEERFRIVANAAPVLIWMSGVDKLCTFFNKPWLEFTGRSLEQEMGNGWAEGVHPDDLQRCLKIYTEAFDSRQAFVMQYRLRCHDGEYRWISDQGVARYDASGNFTGYIGSCVDVTDLISKEGALRESEGKFRLAVEASPSGIVLVDREGKIVLVNTQTEKMFGYSREELIGQSVEIIVPERFRAVHPAHRARFLDAPKARAMGAGRELFARRKDGTEFPIEIGLNPIQTADGILVLAAVADITARKQAELEALRHRDELGHLSRVAAMGELAASIAHELNQPLSGIVSNAAAGQRFIDRGDVDLTELRELLTDINADGRRAGDVIRGIQSMVKKRAPGRERVNLNDLVMKVVQMVKPNAMLHSCEFGTFLDPGLPAVEGDPVQLQQVLLNLVINALDAMRDTSVRSRKVAIATERNGGGTIRISVRDYGVGIPEEARERLFDQFFTTKREGLGMGLSIARSIVESHGGTIAAENADGGGARFQFILPVPAVGAASAHP
jgi:PAS domain S-box-containing protein